MDCPPYPSWKKVVFSAESHMFDFFFRKKNKGPLAWPVDMHSHLVPGIDDGVRTPEDAVAILRHLRDLGVRRWWTTPHVFTDYYPNTPESIRKGLAALHEHVDAIGEDFQVSAAAEYYLDEDLFRQVKAGEELLTLQGKYMLFETSMLSEPMILENFVFEVCCRGFEPILAHPERYDYLLGNFKRIEQLRDRGVLFQVNMLSFLGYYGQGARRMARELTDMKLVDFVGSDCHHIHQAELLGALEKDKWFHRLIDSNSLKNNEL